MGSTATPVLDSKYARNETPRAKKPRCGEPWPGDSGGAAATKEAERNTVAKARELLTAAPGPGPVATERGVLLAGLSSLFGVVIITAVFLHRRSRRER